MEDVGYLYTGADCLRSQPKGVAAATKRHNDVNENLVRGERLLSDGGSKLLTTLTFLRSSAAWKSTIVSMTSRTVAFLGRIFPYFSAILTKHTYQPVPYPHAKHFKALIRLDDYHTSMVPCRPTKSSTGQRKI
eukprot:scaffold3849_cov179-Amphora_coffeaeformis.AAC.24